MGNINSGYIGINITRDQDTASALVPTINHARETALPCPLYHSGAAGIDIMRILTRGNYSGKVRSPHLHIQVLHQD